MEELILALRAAAEPNRFRCLALLAEGEMAVGEIAQVLGQSQPRISRHLRILTEAGLIERHPEGAWVFYRLAGPNAPARAVIDRLVGLAPREDAILLGDRQRLADIRAKREAAAESYFARNAEDWERIRALHLPEADIEQRMRDVAGPGPFDLMIDIGSGSGRMLEVFADRVRRAEGLDPNPKMLAVARAKITGAAPDKFHLRQGDVYALPYPAAAADLVVAHQVLHFLPDPARAVREVGRLLKPGGRFVIADFAPHGREELRERFAHRRLGFSDLEMEQWAQAAGLRIARIETLRPSSDKEGALTVKIWAAERALEDRSEQGAAA